MAQCLLPVHKSRKKLTCQGEWEQLLGAGQMKDRNSSNLSLEKSDNQGAMEVAQTLRV